VDIRTATLSLSRVTSKVKVINSKVGGNSRKENIFGAATVTRNTYTGACEKKDERRIMSVMRNVMMSALAGWLIPGSPIYYASI